METYDRKYGYFRFGIRIFELGTYKRPISLSYERIIRLGLMLDIITLIENK